MMHPTIHPPVSPFAAARGASAPLRRICMAALALIACVFAGGCASTPTVAPADLAPGARVRVAVLDARVPEDHGGSREVEGWWFSARDVYRDSNDGLRWGDALAEEIARSEPGVAVMPRLDLRAWMLARERALKKKLPDLDEDQVKAALAQANPLDYGRALGVDVVFASRITDAWMTHNRSFHWWKSHVIVEVEAWDVSRGEKLMTWFSEDSGLFKSVPLQMESMAPECVAVARTSGVFARPAALPGPAPEAPAAAQR